MDDMALIGSVGVAVLALIFVKARQLNKKDSD